MSHDRRNETMVTTVVTRHQPDYSRETWNPLIPQYSSEDTARLD